MHLPLPQWHQGPSVQAELAVNECWQRAYEWQACAGWWKAYAQAQAYACAQWQAYAQQQRMLLATRSSPCNDNTHVETPTLTRTRNRKPTLRSDMEHVKRAGLHLRSVQRTADGHFIHIGEPIINSASENDNKDSAPDRSEWH